MKDENPSLNSSSVRVAVIGGGYAGLAAAVALARAGIRATVFEVAPVLGGRARKVEHRGIVLDNGLHILIGAYRETLSLLSLVAGTTPPKMQRLPLHWEIAGRFRLRAVPLPPPLNVFFGFACARGATLGEKLAAVRFITRRHSPARDMTVVELLEHNHQGENLTRFFWKPLCMAALNTPVEKASANVFISVVRALGGGGRSSDLVIPAENLSHFFPERAAAYVVKVGGEVQLNCRVTRIRRMAQGFSLETERGERAFTQVICALPPYAVPPLITGFDELRDVKNQLERFDFQPIYSIYLQYAQATRLPFPMLGLPGAPSHWVFDRGQLCRQEGLLGAVISAEGPHQALAHDELAAQVHTQLAQAFGALPQPLWSKVIAEKRATISCDAGTVRPPQRTPLKNFFLAGDYTASELPATIESAVSSGVRCARLALESVSA